MKKKRVNSIITYNFFITNGATIYSPWFLELDFGEKKYYYKQSKTQRKRVGLKEKLDF